MRRAAGSFSGAWLAMKLGIEPRELDIRRRAGELLGVPVDRSAEYEYPAWQFDEHGRPLPEVAQVVWAARGAGLRDRDLADLLQRRDGMTGSGRLVDALREGRVDRVLDAIRMARPRST